MRRHGPYWLLLVVVAVLFCWPLAQNPHHLGIGDWDQFSFFNATAASSIQDYGQFPLWNPWYGGGRPLLANPQEGFLRPGFLLVLIFGTPVGLKLEIFLMTLVGMFGMYWLCRERFLLSPVACTFAGIAFALAGYFSLHLAEGHINRLPLYWLPWIFLFYDRSLEKARWIIPAAFLCALVITSGGVGHVLVRILPFMGLYALVQSGKSMKLRPILFLGIMLAGAASFSAIKLIPTAEYMMQHPRPVQEADSLNGTAVFQILLGRSQLIWEDYPQRRYFKPVQPYNLRYPWHEYGCYLSLFPLLLFVAGIYYFGRRYLALIVATVGCLLLSLGNFAPWAPWSLLQKLPGFNNVRIPSRHIVVFAFGLAVVGALVVERWWRWTATEERKKYRYGLILALVLTGADLIYVNSAVYYQAFPNPVPKIEREKDFVQTVDRNVTRSGAYSSMYLNFLAHRGTVNGYDPVVQPNWALHRSHPKYWGMTRTTYSKRTRVVSWSPNRLKIVIEPRQPVRFKEIPFVEINQNNYPGWKSTAGDIETSDGCIVVTGYDTSPQLEVYYRPTSFLAGLLISLISLIAGLVFFFRWDKFFVRQDEESEA